MAERFQALREVLVQRDAAGLTPLLERRIIEATELTVQRRASEAALGAEAAMLELNQLRGQPWTNALKVESAQLSFPPVPEVDALLSATQTNNFELQMRQAELEQQGFRVSLAKNERNPAVTVGPYLSQERAGDRENAGRHRPLTPAAAVEPQHRQDRHGRSATAASRDVVAGHATEYRTAGSREGAGVSNEAERDGEVAGGFGAAIQGSGGVG